MRALTLILLLASSLTHAAASTDWSKSELPGMTLYRPAGVNAELRLHGPESGNGLDSWFLARKQRAPDGVGGLSIGEPNRARLDVRMAAGIGTRAGGKVVIVAMGCQRKDGRMQYAELLLPPDAALVGSLSEPAANLVASACLSNASTAPTRTAGAAAPLPRAAGALTDARIQEVLYSWDQIYTVGGLQYQEWTYLLLKDGRARKGVPQAPPQLFDVEADVRANPKLWGQWRQPGKDYQVLFDGKWATPPGQLRRRPGKPGERLQGEFEKSESFAFIGGAAAWSARGLRLSADGRFKHWSTSGAGGSMGFGDERTTTGRVTTDKGTSSSVGGPNVGGGSSTSTGVTDADLSGTYHIDGWSLTLRYDNGKTRTGFFFADDKRRHLWFDGVELLRRDKD